MEAASNDKSPTFKAKFLAEYSMGELDYRRFDEWLKFIEKYSAMINGSSVPELEHCQNLFAGLNVLHKQWKPILGVPAVIQDLDNNMKQAKSLKRLWEKNSKNNIPTPDPKKLELADCLDKVYEELMKVKQMSGMGIIVKRNLTTAQKIKRGVRGDRDLSNLPEA